MTAPLAILDSKDLVKSGVILSEASKIDGDAASQIDVFPLDNSPYVCLQIHSTCQLFACACCRLVDLTLAPRCNVITYIILGK